MNLIQQQEILGLQLSLLLEKDIIIIITNFNGITEMGLSGITLILVNGLSNFYPFLKSLIH